jgi:hypothetical protein
LRAHMPQDCALGLAMDITHNLIGSRTLYGKVACSAHISFKAIQ